MYTNFVRLFLSLLACRGNIHLVKWIFIIVVASFPAFAQYTSTTTTSQKAVAASDDSPLSAELKSRVFLPYTNTTGNGWLNELTLTYDLDTHWSFGLWGGYIQYFDANRTTYSEWEDSELSVTYSFFHKKHFPKPILELTFGAVLPTSLKYDQEQTEIGGVFLRDRFAMDYSYARLEQKLTVYQYFYRNSSYIDTIAQSKPSPNSDSSEDNYALLDTSDPVASSPTLISNSVYYVSAKLIGLLPIITKPLMLRNEVWYESYQNFDGTATNIIHDLPGIGYKWSSHLNTWLSLDCNKNMSKDGSVFDKNNIVSLFTVYLSI